MNIQPQNYFSHDQCPGHLFKEFYGKEKNLVFSMKQCVLCFYVEGDMGPEK